MPNHDRSIGNETLKWLSVMAARSLVLTKNTGYSFSGELCYLRTQSKLKHHNTSCSYWDSVFFLNKCPIRLLCVIVIFQSSEKVTQKGCCFSYFFYKGVNSFILRFYTFHILTCMLNYSLFSNYGYNCSVFTSISLNDSLKPPIILLII